MCGLGVARRDHRVGEQAEAHGAVGFGMMAGRAHGAEGIGRLAREHRIDGEHRPADGVRRHLEASRRHPGVGVELGDALLRHRGADGGDVARIVGGREHRIVGRPRPDPLQPGEPLVGQGARDRAQPIRPLGMPGRGDVLEEEVVGDEKGGHALRLRDGHAACNGLTGGCLRLAASDRS